MEIISFWLKFVPKGSINNMSASVQKNGRLRSYCLNPWWLILTTAVSKTSILIQFARKFVLRSPIDKKTALVQMDSGHNGHKPKRPKPKRPQTGTATNRNGHKPERPQTERPQTETATNRNGHKYK